MVYYNGPESIIESIYLGEELGETLGSITVEVNPGTIKFLSGKTIVINRKDYPESILKGDLGYGNTIISRVHKDIPGVRYVPYLKYPVKGIVWSGDTVNYLSPEILRKEVDNPSWWYSFETKILHFPRPILYPEVTEPWDAFTFALYQIGEIEDDSWPCMLSRKLKGGIG